MCVRECAHIYVSYISFKKREYENIYSLPIFLSNICSLPNILAMDEFMKFKPNCPQHIQSARSTLASSQQMGQPGAVRSSLQVDFRSFALRSLAARRCRVFTSRGDFTGTGRNNIIASCFMQAVHCLPAAACCIGTVPHTYEQRTRRWYCHNQVIAYRCFSSHNILFVRCYGIGKFFY